MLVGGQFRGLRSDTKIMADASRRVAQRGACNDVQITTDARWWATQRATCSDAQIALENAARANARTLLHPDRQ
ncbi:unnamed protein product [Sphagnum jensenii]|jgi:hypothetical protein|uniref:Uncharacterized protein n=1 Tax=Sphagnum jensenii TaxID=128206 RepID=A0ABP0WZM3_9BRYO